MLTRSLTGQTYFSLVASQMLNEWYQNDCIGRESNPGLPRGRREFYHWTTDAYKPPVSHPILFLMNINWKMTIQSYERTEKRASFFSLSAQLGVNKRIMTDKIFRDLLPAFFLKRSSMLLRMSEWGRAVWVPMPCSWQPTCGGKTVGICTNYSLTWAINFIFYGNYYSLSILKR